MRWTFRTYRTVSGDDVIDQWYQGLSVKSRARVLTRLLYIGDQPREGWKRPHFDLLSGDCSGLGEIRFKIDRTQFRLVGFFGPEREEFTIVTVAVEKDSEFEPKNACKIAQRRKKEILEEPERSDEWRPARTVEDDEG